jgi:hypothetical protein
MADNSYVHSSADIAAVCPVCRGEADSEQYRRDRAAEKVKIEAMARHRAEASARALIDHQRKAMDAFRKKNKGGVV